MATKKQEAQPGVKIEYMLLEDLVPAARNAKLHDLPSLKDSFRRFGFVQVPALNERTGRMVAGHGRKEALLEMQAAGEPAPKRVQVIDGKWFIPVLRGVSFETDEEAEAYVLADNRITIIAGNDDSILLPMLESIAASPSGLTGVGFSNEFLDDLRRLSQGVDVAAGDVNRQDEWAGMPGYENTNQQGLKLIVHFKNTDALKDFAKLCGYTLTDKTKFVWFPDEPNIVACDKAYVGSDEASGEGDVDPEGGAGK